MDNLKTDLEQLELCRTYKKKTDLQKLEKMLELLQDFRTIYRTLSDESVYKFNKEVEFDLYNAACNLMRETSVALEVEEARQFLDAKVLDITGLN